jgi:hypothetical protein
VAVADTSDMPISVTMAFSHESEQPGIPRDGAVPRPDRSAGESGSDEALSAERMARIIRRLDSGFYDSPEVREQIAREALKELDQ